MASGWPELSNIPLESELPDAAKATLRVQTLGGFRIWRSGLEITHAAWGREKAIHLFQFFITTRRRAPYLHKEQIIDRLWPQLSPEEGDRDFKVALHAVNKTLEPDRPPRTEPRFIQRHELTYGLNLAEVWIDADAFETLLTAGNHALPDHPEAAITFYRQAMALYQGDFLPERRYEDWSSAERERLQVLGLGLMVRLADLLLATTPLESIRLAQQVLAIDPVWEDAYRIQIKAYLAQGNRPLALRSYEQCVQVLARELGLEPLPETRQLYELVIHS
jgi:DNA-binding SARP family transcriptional activator